MPTLPDPYVPVNGAHLRHAYHLVDGVEGFARLVRPGFAAFYPGQSKQSMIVHINDLCLGPYVPPGRP